MLYLYDDAICDDLRESFNEGVVGQPVVSVVSPENITSIAAQVQDDVIHFPLVAVEREKETPIDARLTNFTRSHKGVATVFDSKTNMLYFEKSIPIKLSYNLIVMSTNTADIDEILRELIFKYTQQYFLSIKVPYESKRRIRFGIYMNQDQNIEWYSTSSNYLKEGTLHSAGIHLDIDGAVLLTYTPVHLRRIKHEVVPVAKTDATKI